MINPLGTRAMYNRFMTPYGVIPGTEKVNFIKLTCDNNPMTWMTQELHERWNAQHTSHLLVDDDPG